MTLALLPALQLAIREWNILENIITLITKLDAPEFSETKLLNTFENWIFNNQLQLIKLQKIKMLKKLDYRKFTDSPGRTITVIISIINTAILSLFFCYHNYFYYDYTQFCIYRYCSLNMFLLKYKSIANFTRFCQLLALLIVAFSLTKQH